MAEPAFWLEKGGGGGGAITGSAGAGCQEANRKAKLMNMIGAQMENSKMPVGSSDSWPLHQS